MVQAVAHFLHVTCGNRSNITLWITVTPHTQDPTGSTLLEGEADALLLDATRWIV